MTMTFYSCESLIEVELPSDQLNSEEVFRDKNTTEAALMNLYSSFRDQSLFYGSGSSGATGILGCYTDELDTFSKDTDIYTNTLTANSVALSNSFWNNTYANIYTINSFIEGLSNSEYIDVKTKSIFLAEASFLRAIQYQYLTQLFGDIPLVTSTNYRKNSRVSKSSSIEILNFVQQELLLAQEAIENTYRQPDRIFPNKTTIELVLAKNYLLQKRYDLAQTHAQNVIDTPLYSLENDLSKVFKKNAKSTLWQLSSSLTSAAGSNLSTTAEGLSYILTSTPPTSIVLSVSLLNSFSQNDKRKDEWISSISDNTNTYYFAFKYKNKANNTDEYSIVFRIEEAYFTLMEALAYQNRIPEAVSFLNIIRQRAGLPSIDQDITQQEFIDLMIKEGRNEFFTESMHRFLDLKRNNRLDVLKLTKVNWQDKHQLLPIPEKEILLNPNLLPQNDGY